MQIDIGINPNCSEATIRILLQGQNEKKIEALKNKLSLEIDKDYMPEEKSEWDGDPTREFDFSEAYINDKTIFGVRVLEISGDAPYNHGEEITSIIKRYLPKAEIEWNES